jgi:hypothetical protein
MAIKLKRGLVIIPQWKPYNYTITAKDVTSKYTEEKYNTDDDDAEYLSAFYNAYTMHSIAQQQKKEGEVFSIIFSTDTTVHIELLEEEKAIEYWRVKIDRYLGTQKTKLATYECYVASQDLQRLVDV